MEGGAALRRVAVVVSQHAAEPFAALDLADLLTDLAARAYDLVAQPLMVSFPMIMIEIRMDDPAGQDEEEELPGAQDEVHPDSVTLAGWSGERIPDIRRIGWLKFGRDHAL